MKFLDRIRPKSFTLKNPPLQWFGRGNTEVVTPHQYRTWLFACSMAIAEKVQQMEIVVKRRIGNETQVISEHPFLTLWNNPHPFYDIEDLLGITSSCLTIYGEAFWLIHTNEAGNQIESFEPLYPTQVDLKHDSMGEFTHYEYRDSRRHLIIPPELMIHPRRPNPINFERGAGAFEAGYDVLKADQQAIQFHLASFANRAIPAGILQSEKHLDRKARQQLLDEWEESNRGVNRANKLTILPQNLKYQSVAQNMRDIELTESKRYNEHTIKQITRVSGAILGNEAGSNRATAEAQEAIFAKNVTKPQGETIIKAVRRRVLPFYEPTLTIELKDPVPADNELALRMAVESVNKFRTINEVREEFGYEPIPGGDVIYTGLNQAPLGFAVESQQEPDPEAV